MSATERALAQEARRGGRAIIALHKTAIYGGGVIQLRRLTSEAQRWDRDRANGTVTTSSGKVYSAEVVRQWALEDAAALRWEQPAVGGPGRWVYTPQEATSGALATR